MTFTCRQLSIGDVPLLKALLNVFGHAFDDIDTYQSAVPDNAYLLALLAKQHFIVVVAVDDAGKVVGGLAGYELDKFEQDRREIYIYDLAVAEHSRRRGVATALIRELQRIARERQVYVIYVQADPGDKPAIQLYESFGTREDVHHFDIPVGDDSPAKSG